MDPSPFSLLIGLVIGAVLTWLAHVRLRGKARRWQGELALSVQESTHRQAEIDRLQRQIEAVTADSAALRSEWMQALRLQGAAEARVEELARHQAGSQASLRTELQAITQQLLDQGGRQWANQGEERLSLLLAPLQSRLQEFQARLEDGRKQEDVQRALLKQEVENLARSGFSLSQEAHRLTTALATQNKTQGILGEVILESLLIQAGLEAGRDFELQARGLSEAGRILQPDVILHLPGDRDLVIDSKVSLTAFERWRHGEAGESAEAEAHLKAHAHSVRRHIQGLSEKRYHDIAGLKTLDFVILFMPLEGAYQAALAADPGLHQMAWERNLLILPPSGLIAALRMVSGLWQGELRQRHAQELARLAANLHDKLVGFTEEWDRCQRALVQAQEALQGAKRRLWSGRGGAGSILERMRALGLSPNKELAVDWRESESEGHSPVQNIPSSPAITEDPLSGVQGKIS